MKNQISRTLLLFLALLVVCTGLRAQEKRPNVILIYADDLGYGDLSCYGATQLRTPHLDQLAAEGLRFTNGHSSSATCTPSRYALMTGQYPWRVGAAILPGDAALIIPVDKMTLPRMFKQAGYQTGIVGKWHLGLGTQVAKDWNGEVRPGPLELGFDQSFIFPATADRVPTVFLENHRVVGLDPGDPIAVDYQQKIGHEPTGLEHPELLKLLSSHGHNNTIVNGIGRIGFMTGGKTARWTDEELSLTFLNKAQSFIETHKAQPFFLFFALTEPHVPRMPATIFKGKSGMGLRGDAILQLDWTVGEIMKQLRYLGLEENTLIIFSSDNGPVLDDGYQDQAEELVGTHRPAGPLRGGKYSSFEAGTRVPLIIRWPAVIQPGISDALVSQMDFLASFNRLLQQPALPSGQDSEDHLAAFLGKSNTGRQDYVQQGPSLSMIRGHWKYIPPRAGVAMTKNTHTETGNSKKAQLYDLRKDPGEKNNLAVQYPEKVAELAAALKQIRQQ
ncbi:arylsulfatase [Niabella terrae]